MADGQTPPQEGDAGKIGAIINDDFFCHFDQPSSIRA
jgi:hypothetical protein